MPFDPIKEADTGLEEAVATGGTFTKRLELDELEESQVGLYLDRILAGEKNHGLRLQRVRVDYLAFAMLGLDPNSRRVATYRDVPVSIHITGPLHFIETVVSPES